MTITHKLKLDLQRKGELQRLDVVQGDAFTRRVELELLCDGKPWNIPFCNPVVRYSKPDGTEGIYDTLPDGKPGVTYSGNTLTLELAPQMLTCPGPVQVQVELNLEDQKLATFTFMVVAEPGVALAGKSEDYVNWTKAFLPQTTGAKAGQYVRVAEVDATGRILKVVSANTPDDAMQAALSAKDAAENAGSKAGQAATLAAQANNNAAAALEKANAALPSDSLPGVINDALAEAKESGEFDGKDGKDGKDGENGKNGSNGLSVLAVNITAGDAQKIEVYPDNVIENEGALFPRDILIGDKVLTEDGKIFIVSSFGTKFDATTGSSTTYYSAKFLINAGGSVKSVNGITPDENGNVEIQVSGGNVGLTQPLRIAIYNLLMDALYQSSGHEADKAELAELLTGGSVTPDVPDGPVITYYTIEKTLTNVSISNGTATIAAGNAYSAILTADEGYTLGEVSVTMGGVPVTVTNGVINIASVTGNIVIVATAEAESVGGEGSWESGTPFDLTGKVNGGITDYLYCYGAEYIVIGADKRYTLNFYDAAKTLIVSEYVMTEYYAVPTNAIYLTIAEISAQYWPLDENTVIIPVVVDKNFTTGENAITWVSGSINLTTGEIETASTLVSNYIAIGGATSADKTASVTAFYDKDKKLLWVKQNYELSALPACASYMRVQVFASNKYDTITLA